MDTYATDLEQMLRRVVREELTRLLAPDARAAPSRAVWMNVAEASDYAGRSTVTIYRALYSKSLHGVQLQKGAHWSIHLDCLDSWAFGDRCLHQTVPTIPRATS